MTQTDFPANPVLLIDDETSWLRALDSALKAAGITNIMRCSDSREVLKILDQFEVSVVTLDLVMPHVSGEELLAHITETFPDVPAIVMTAMNQVDRAVSCMKKGAFDFFVKTTDMNRLVGGIRRAIELHELRRENDLLRKRFLQHELAQPEAFSKIITQDRAMFALFRYIEAVAPTIQPVLITGESGVGKELVARAVHELSRHDEPFVAVNVAGLDDTLFADTLFGHRKGAYTGAEQSRNGLVEQAEGGTLFLDEIGDLTPASQAKLLRLLQEREYLPLGSDIAKRATARIVAATNQPLDALRLSGHLRKDLYYRLQTHHIHIPPLRERLGDIPLLTERFLAEAALELNKPKPTVPHELYALLASYSFPGNVRELQSIIYDVASGCTSQMLPLQPFKRKIQEVGGLPSDIPIPVEQSPLVSFSDTTRIPTLREGAQLLIEEAMRRAQNNQGLAAAMLGITRQALNQRLKIRQPDNED